jgi:hypothetical protein
MLRVDQQIPPLRRSRLRDTPPQLRPYFQAHPMHQAPDECRSHTRNLVVVYDEFDCKGQSISRELCRFP